jgi:hypothetical protein
VAGIKQAELVNIGMRVDRLAAAASCAEADLSRIACASLVDGRRSSHLLGHRLVPKEVKLTQPKLCPQCVAEKGFIEAHWHLEYGNGSYAVRRMTVRKRMRKKLQEIKQQLRMRMHDPVPQTGTWLRSVVQGYFNYYAVPGNLDSMGLFRERVLRYWGQALKRRSQRHRYAWARRLNLAAQWLPPPRVLHPWPLDRFAASHPR